MHVQIKRHHSAVVSFSVGMGDIVVYCDITNSNEFLYTVNWKILNIS